jgi:tetratricopeptide (TPR) repeat protein
MADPNANALAQAEWASPKFGDDLYSVSTLCSVEEAYEARAQHLFREGKFADVYLECEAWMEDESYSVRPYELSASAANVLEDHEKGDEITRRGLRRRPDSIQLLNCRAFALACQNRLDEAEAVLVKIASEAPEWTRLVADANRGLIAFRRGKYLEGITCYEQAIGGFKRSGLSHMALSASTYLCREMVRADLPVGKKMAEALRLAVKNSQDNAIKKAFQGVEDFLAAQQEVRQMENQLTNS